MEPSDNGNWHASATIKKDTDKLSVKYRYSVVNDCDTTTIREEYGAPHSIDITDQHINHLSLIDRWNDIPPHKPFYAQAFTKCINRRREVSAQASSATPGHMLIRIEAPEVSPDETLVMTGSCDFLGNWDPKLAPEMNDTLFPTWQLSIPVDELPENFEYKMVKVKRSNREIIKWEDGTNRYFSKQCTYNADTTVIGGLIFNLEHPTWRGTGVAIPVFSLRSNEDWGAGDFLDLIRLTDWANATGQQFIQILPINDTTMTGTWMDSYPYNANSTFALHPLYLRLDAMGVFDDQARNKHYRDLADELNSLKSIDYERVTQLKIAYTRELFELKGTKTLESDSFKKFVADNEEWLRPYAAFCVLRDIYGTPCFEQWEQYSHFDANIIDRFIESHQHDIDYVYYLQYHLNKQLRQAGEYARKHGVAIKGDIPIGISRTSVDAWTNPQLFYLDSQAGAPPDDFSILGQNWGFPTYNWEEMSRDGFKWWKGRFVKMAQYCDAYRIDHVLGFFRIWQIPMDAIHGLLGYFNQALPLTAEEMARDYDFTFDADLFTQPYITDKILHELFAEYHDEVSVTYLEKTADNRYTLKPPYSTQRQIAELSVAMESTDRTKRITNGLMALIDEVLFIKDPHTPDRYHPRIAASQTHIYHTLNEFQRQRFDRLYNDFFYHRHNDFWLSKAMWKLPPLINATGMLTCAEDLGMIPHCVPEVMERLRILSLEIQRMPKDPGYRFGDPSHYPYYSVCTTSTHDMSGIRGWWEENRESTQQFYNEVLGHDGKAPCFAEPWICEEIVRMHLASPSMLCILPLQDWLSIDGTLRRENPNDERINVPADSRHYWRYRMHLPLESLLENTAFNSRLKKMLTDSHRQ